MEPQIVYLSMVEVWLASELADSMVRLSVVTLEHL
jgi:hypothetical protein